MVPNRLLTPALVEERSGGGQDAHGVASRRNTYEPRRRAAHVGGQARLDRSPADGFTEEGLSCDMHVARVHRLPAAFEHSDDRHLNPVVPTMPVADGRLRSLDVAELTPAVVVIKLVERSEDTVQQRLRVRGGGWNGVRLGPFRQACGYRPPRHGSSPSMPIGDQSESSHSNLDRTSRRRLGQAPSCVRRPGHRSPQTAESVVNPDVSGRSGGSGARPSGLRSIGDCDYLPVSSADAGAWSAGGSRAEGTSRRRSRNRLDC